MNVAQSSTGQFWRVQRTAWRLGQVHVALGRKHAEGAVLRPELLRRALRPKARSHGPITLKVGFGVAYLNRAHFFKSA